MVLHKIEDHFNFKLQNKDYFFFLKKHCLKLFFKRFYELTFLFVIRVESCNWF